jgi:hypothetical protein
MVAIRTDYQKLETNVDRARVRGSPKRPIIAASIAAVILSAGAAAAALVGDGFAPLSWLTLTAEILAGPLHPFLDLQRGFGVQDVIIPLFLGALTLHQLWRGVLMQHPFCKSQRIIA